MGLVLLRKNLLFAVVFLIQTQVNSQDIFVKANTYIYIGNQFVYAKNNIELNAATSNIYLRNDGQLLQGTTGAGSNKGLGSLSVFQEGSANNFQYNYWCSPVGNVNTSTSVNNPFGIGQLGAPTSVTATTPAIALPGNIYDGTASPFKISSAWIYKMVAQTTYSGWVQVGSASTLNPGEGFTMKGSSGTDLVTVNGVQNNPDGRHQRYDFRGKPNDGTIPIPVLPGKLTLTGNPYPSAIDLNAFLLGETNCTGTAYFWEHDKMVNSHYLADYKGGYGTYTAAGVYAPAVFFSYDGAGNQISTVVPPPGGTYERRYSPIGQGFVIQGSASASGNVQMKNSYRVFVKEGIVTNSQFEKVNNKKKAEAANLIPQIRFNTLLDNGPVSQTVMVFDPSFTDGADRAFDGQSANDSPANNYFVINNKEYVINAVSFDINKKIPIGFRNKAKANYKITVKEILNAPEITEVYLHDKTTNVYYDIKNSFYDLTLPAGTYNTRYEITFKNATSLGVEEMESKKFLVQQDNVNKNLIISNPLQLEITNCSLYDVVGKLIFTNDKLGNESAYTFKTDGLSDGLYIVKLTSADKAETGVKILVKN